MQNMRCGDVVSSTLIPVSFQLLLSCIDSVASQYTSAIDPGVVYISDKKPLRNCKLTFILLLTQNITRTAPIVDSFFNTMEY